MNTGDFSPEIGGSKGDLSSTEPHPDTGPAITQVTGGVPPVNLAERFWDIIRDVVGGPPGRRLVAMMMLAVVTALACYVTQLAVDRDNGDLVPGGSSSEGSNVSVETGVQFPVYDVQQQAGRPAPRAFGKNTTTLLKFRRRPGRTLL